RLREGQAHGRRLHAALGHLAQRALHRPRDRWQVLSQPTFSPAWEDESSPPSEPPGAFRMPNATQIATLHTSAGDIRIELFGNHAPKTVKNFVDLATGGREWTHPGTRTKSSEPLYDGTVFHRVIPGFMIQGGDPLGEGYGDPGYKFADE